jgi:hypothetical protein
VTQRRFHRLEPFATIVLTRYLRLHALTARMPSGSIARVKRLLFCTLMACTSCTTLENRRDLYRSPAEGYEEWYPYPPPTRKPAAGPVSTTTTTTTTTQRHGVISYPGE